jgi:hypothetical protein
MRIWILIIGLLALVVMTRQLTVDGDLSAREFAMLGIVAALTGLALLIEAVAGTIEARSRHRTRQVFAEQGLDGEGNSLAERTTVEYEYEPGGVITPDEPATEDGGKPRPSEDLLLPRERAE